MEKEFHMPSPEEGRRAVQEERDNHDSLDEKDVRELVDSELHNLGLDVEDLRGKKVLDLGSGYSLLERAARSIGINSIISMDIDPDTMSKRKELAGRVVGDAEKMPLKDGSVDLVVLHSVLPDNPDGVIAEINRVLEDDGEARICPVERFLPKLQDKELQSLSTQLRQLWKQKRQLDNQPGDDLLSTKQQIQGVCKLIGKRQLELAPVYHSYFKNLGYDITIQPSKDQPESIDKVYLLMKKISKESVR